MKKFLAMLLAALLVVSMFTFAMADEAEEDPKDPALQELENWLLQDDEEGGEEGGEEEEEEETVPNQDVTLEDTEPEESPNENYNNPQATDPVAEANACDHKDADGNSVLIVRYVAPKDDPCTGRVAVIGFCPLCNENVDMWTNDPLGHDPDLTKAYVKDGKNYAPCKRCGKDVEVSSADKPVYADHRWSAAAVIRDATCVSKGVKKYYCVDCGEIKVREIDMLSEHKFDLKASTTYVAKRANCEANGAYSAICTICGGRYEWDDAAGYGKCVAFGTVGEYTYTDDEGNTITVVPEYNNTSAAKPRGTKVLKIAACDHEWSVAKVITEVNCVQDGEAEFVCMHNTQTATHDPCFATMKRTLNRWEDVLDNRFGQWESKYHNWIEVIDQPIDANGVGIHHYVCKKCGHITQEYTFTASTVRYNGMYDAKKAGVVSGSNTGAASQASTTTTTTTKKPSSSSTNKKGVSIPKTNDSTSNLPYVLIAAAFIGLVALVASKKKVHG